VSGALQSPLGNRVLIDEGGIPASVVPIEADTHDTTGHR
jgi:hypothetical protein